MPQPQNPQGVQEFVARQEDDAAFISALAEAARGQVVGARTATEMAIIDAQMRTRLATREGISTTQSKMLRGRRSTSAKSTCGNLALFVSQVTEAGLS